MSDILIKDMDMQKSCGDCRFCFIRHGDSLCESDMFCFLTNKELCLYKNRESINNIKIGDCPIKEVPTHGDLIDKTELREHAYVIQMRDKISFQDALALALRDAPTVLEASTSPSGFCNTEGCSNISSAQNHICPYYQGVCSLDEKIFCYCRYSYEMCDKFIKVIKGRG